MPSIQSGPKVRVETSLLVPGCWDDLFPLSSSTSSVESLLRHIGEQMKLDLLDAEGELIDFLSVRLNGKDINFLPRRLATPLREDDLVSIQLVPIGGG